MKKLFLTSITINMLLFLFVYTVPTYAQNSNSSSAVEDEELYITVRGSVIDIETLEPVSKVNIEVTGGNYTTTSSAGEFRIQARIGDDLVIRSAGFETKYYTIKDNQRIRIEVHPLSEEITVERVEKKKKRALSFGDYIQNSKDVYKDDFSQGVDNIELALKISTITNIEKASAYELLGDIYVYQKQHDLAVENYETSLKNRINLTVEIKLAKAYFDSKNYQESIALYQTILNKKLSFEQNLESLEGLGDAYKSITEYSKAIQEYTKAETIASSSFIIDLTSRLNRKIAECYDLNGDKEKAILFYEKTLILSNQENSESAARSKVKVADYYNKSQLYDEEITLRKEALEGLNNVNTDSISNDDVLTSQKQNYKIARAYVAQQKNDEAISFFEKSITEAANKNDIVVEKDAARSLSELHRDEKDYDKAVESYERYMALVDKDYQKKEQELHRAERLRNEYGNLQSRLTSLEKDKELNEEKYTSTKREQALIDAKENVQQLIVWSLIVVAVLLLIAAFAMYRSSKQQKYANNLLALKGLRSQMNPHFIFNALNSVNSFIATNDERTANKYLSDFSSLMRSVLENSEEDFIPLSSEIELIKKYTMLEHFRFKDKFDYTLTVDETLSVDEFQIPPMLLQPYVENAVWHGMRYKEEKGLLHIHFGQKDEDTAVITVTDDGVGRERSKAMKTENQKKQKSKGMSNIKKRIAILNEMYGGRVDVSITDVFEGGEGTKVTLTLKKN
ncbi:histidine kinase [Dokdonia sp.]|uniref:histidine kinase n=1 Tax=Dokdonia sp. TaxID=2024995 RepID=UPI0032645EB8